MRVYSLPLLRQIFGDKVLQRNPPVTRLNGSRRLFPIRRLRRQLDTALVADYAASREEVPVLRAFGLALHVSFPSKLTRCRSNGKETRIWILLIDFIFNPVPSLGGNIRLIEPFDCDTRLADRLGQILPLLTGQFGAVLYVSRAVVMCLAEPDSSQFHTVADYTWWFLVDHHGLRWLLKHDLPARASRLPPGA
jgi:hypothetical protein